MPSVTAMSVVSQHGFIWIFPVVFRMFRGKVIPAPIERDSLGDNWLSYEK